MMLNVIKKLKTKFLVNAMTEDGIPRKVFLWIVSRKIKKWMEVNKMDLKNMSWQPKLFGAVGALGTYLETLNDPPWLPIVGKVLLMIGMFGVGASTRQNNKSSEQVGAGVIPPK